MSGSWARRRGRLLAMTMIALGTTGCAGMAPLGDVLAPPRGVGGAGRGVGQVGGEVQAVDTRRQELRVISGWNQVSRVRYDGRTRVQYGSRRYSVRDLRRGDLIRVWVREGGRDRYATRIEVLERERDRRGRGRGRRVEAPAERIKRDGVRVHLAIQPGSLAVRKDEDQALIVMLPADPRKPAFSAFGPLGQRGSGTYA